MPTTETRVSCDYRLPGGDTEIAADLDQSPVDAGRRHDKQLVLLRTNELATVKIFGGDRGVESEHALISIHPPSQYTERVRKPTGLRLRYRGPHTSFTQVCCSSHALLPHALR